jgi:hypothetical protein
MTSHPRRHSITVSCDCTFTSVLTYSFWIFHKSFCILCWSWSVSIFYFNSVISMETSWQCYRFVKSVYYIVTWSLKLIFFFWGGDGLQNESLNLICYLDEQTATVEQLSNATEQQVAYALSNLSDAGLCHMCTLMCSMSASEQSRLGSLVCRLLLVPRVGNVADLKIYNKLLCS